MNKVKVSMMLRPEVKENAMKIAKEKGIPFSYYVEQAVLKQLKKDNK